jgi:protein-S-isoprenylcysteine O-methyltransferase Ste14
MPELLLRLVMMALGRSGISERIAAASYRAALAGLFLALGGLALFAALVCAGVGVWLFAASQIGSVGASVVVAGTLLVVGLILMITAWYVVRRKPAQPPTQAATSSKLLQEATELFKTHKQTMLLAALIAGIVVETTQRRK